MKKWFALLLAVATLTCLCACGNDNNRSNKKENGITTPAPLGNNVGVPISSHTAASTGATSGSTGTTADSTGTTDFWEGNLEGDNQFNDAVLDWEEDDQYNDAVLDWD